MIKCTINHLKREDINSRTQASMEPAVSDEETMKLSERMLRLGTETAFAVSQQAAEYAKNGKKVFPFHLGDMNIKTPPNIIKAAVRAMENGKTGYAPNAGIPELREAVAEEINRGRRTDYTWENVAIQPGGKPVIGKFILSVMNPGDEVLYPNPGYPIYESQIEFHGGTAIPYTYREGKNGFEIDLDGLKKSITRRTRILIFNNFQNPLGCESSRAELEEIAAIAVKHDLYVLSDEAYFDIRYSGQSQSIVSFPGMPERTVILYTFSKKFAMTGWRLGAAAGEKTVIGAIAKINVNDESCSNHFVQWAALEALKGDQSGHREIIKILKSRRDVAVRLLNSIGGVRCFTPETTFYLFPNVTEAMARLGYDRYPDLQRDLLEKTGVSLCTRLHFGRPLPGEKERYLRLAYSGIDADMIEQGLEKFKAFIERTKDV